jgi:enoyl-CoA hydratase
MSEADGSVRAERNGAVLTLTLDRPSKLNAFSPALVRALAARLEEARTDASVWVVVLTGQGGAFSAGADLVAMCDSDREAAAAFVRAGSAMVNAVENLGKPVIAAINGPALGGGLELALGCTIRIASDRAVFALPEVTVGLIPGWGGTQRLARLIGRSRAALMALTGEPVDAATAYSWGLVDRVVPHDDLLGSVAAMCRRIAGHRPEAMTRIASLVASTGEDLGAGLARETESFRELFNMPDTPGIITAFLESRKSKRAK